MSFWSVVAGRFAQPANSAVLITTVATMSWEPRVTMTPPFALRALDFTSTVNRITATEATKKDWSIPRCRA